MDPAIINLSPLTTKQRQTNLVKTSSGFIFDCDGQSGGPARMIVPYISGEPPFAVLMRARSKAKALKQSPESVALIECSLMKQLIKVCTGKSADSIFDLGYEIEVEVIPDV